MKFLADMGVSPRCVEWLRSKEYDAVHLCEQGSHKFSDRDVLYKAHSENRILLTMDLDFAGILTSLKTDMLPVTVIFRLSDQRPNNIQAMLDKLLPILEKYYNHGAVIISVNDNKIRIRRLPINTP